MLNNKIQRIQATLKVAPSRILKAANPKKTIKAHLHKFYRLFSKQMLKVMFLSPPTSQTETMSILFKFTPLVYQNRAQIMLRNSIIISILLCKKKKFHAKVTVTANRSIKNKRFAAL